MTGGGTAGAVHPHANPRRGWRVRGSIANLLRLLVTVPLLAALGFAGLALLGSIQQVINAGDTQRRVALATDAGALTRALQAERAAAAVALASTEEAAVQGFDEEVARTDVTIGAFHLHPTPGGAAGSALRRVHAGLQDLAGVRGQVRSSPTASLSAISFSYRILIADLLAFRESVTTGASPQIADDIRAAAALTQGGESIGQLQIAVLRSLAMGELTPAAQQEIAGARARLSEASNAFLERARPSWLAQWGQIGTHPQVITAQRLQDEVGRTVPGGRILIETTEWVATTNAWMTELYRVQRTVDAAAAGEVTAARGDELRSAVLQASAVLGIIALTAALTSVVARRITRRLRSLRESASAAAYQRLPAVVRTLNAVPPGTVKPDEVADQSAAEFTLAGDDEIAEVGAAVRALHREAVRVAGEQAVMRDNIAEIFVHLSRREQRLVDAILAQVDRVERDETDPERLRRLYELDHLATRMARINQSLLVLGGSGTSRVRHESVPLVKVIQAALSQIEQYTRVRIAAVDEALHLAGDAADEIVHLLAELMDNATAYSPPETDVWATCHAPPDRVVVQVLDEGVGLSAQRCAQINAELAAPAAVELAGVRAMGLMVVARLAARHGVRVELRAGLPRGTVAEVVIPTALICQGRPVPRAQLPGAAGAEQIRAQPVVNGWFKSSLDGAQAATAWAIGTGGDRWTADRRAPAAPLAARSTGGGLTRRIPQPHLVPDALPSGGSAGAPPHRRLDPNIIAAAMSAYARGVAGRRAPSS